MIVADTNLLVEGMLHRQDSVTSIRAGRLWPLRARLAPTIPSHDFR